MKSSQESRFRRVAIVGLGLMGGSLARALKALPDPPHIRATARDPQDVRAGLDSGAVDEGADGAEALLVDRDLVVYATPLLATLELLAEQRPFIGRESVVTDVASLKGPVLTRVRELGLEGRYVGSHPMVGGTGAGFSFSSDDLFQAARVWVVSGSRVPPDSVHRITALWRAVGAIPEAVGAEEHDRSMVWVSHLPQLASNALALTMKGAGFERAELGSGGRDMTRLAGSAPEMWRDLLTMAPSSLEAALASMVDALEGIRQCLAQKDFDEVGNLMRKTRAWVEKGS